MIVDNDYQGYDMEKCGRKIVPASARPARNYIWYHHMHRPHVLELSRKQGKPWGCMTHPDGRCSKGWDEGWDGTVSPPEPPRTIEWVRAEDMAYYRSILVTDLARELLWPPQELH